jgi:hypothetical protein
MKANPVNAWLLLGSNDYTYVYGLAAALPFSRQICNIAQFWPDPFPRHV